MSELPDSIARLDLYSRASIVAHEWTHALYSAIVAERGEDAEARRLLKEAADIAVVHMPRALAEVERLRARHEDLAILDPEGASATLAELDNRAIEAEPEVRALRSRQDEIVRELRRILEADR